MTADLTPRERVVLAIGSVAVGPFGPNALAIVNQGGSTYLTSSEAQDMTDAALAALADHPGLVEVLARVAWAHRLGAADHPGEPTPWDEGQDTPSGARVRAAFEARVAPFAEAIRAWLRGTS